MNTIRHTSRYLLLIAILFAMPARAQNEARVNARLDARQITVGDPARLFIEVHHNPAAGKIQWPAVADSFGKLEVTEKGKIDTVSEAQGNVMYRQRITITGFDSGLFKVPAISFTVTPASGAPYTLQTDSFQLLVQTVPVDTTKEFKPIKNILLVQETWWEKYMWYVIGAIVLLAIAIPVTIYLARRKPKAPAPKAPQVPLQDRVLKELAELEAQQLWQKGLVKEYYVQLTGIVRNYIEERFNTPAMELTTDELLYKVQYHRELQPYQSMLAGILHTADLAKFAKGQPLPQEHFDAMENARQLVETSRPKPVITETQTEQKK